VEKNRFPVFGAIITGKPSWAFPGHNSVVGTGYFAPLPTWPGGPHRASLPSSIHAKKNVDRKQSCPKSKSEPQEHLFFAFVRGYRTSQLDCAYCREVFFPLRHSPKNQTGSGPLQAQIAQSRTNQPINQPVLFGGLPVEEVPGREKQNCTHKRDQNPHRVCLWNR
jgi:hypothetical protein